MLWTSCCPGTLRFPNALDEAAFKTTLEMPILRSVLFVYVPILLWYLIPFIRYFSRESARVDDPFVWSSLDSRTMVFGCMLFGFMSSTCMFFVALLRFCFGVFRCFDNHWELIVVAFWTFLAIMLPLASPGLVATLFGEKPDSVWSHAGPQDFDLAELYFVLGINVGMTILCFSVPVRACVVWIVPVCALTTYFVYLFAVVFPEPLTHAINFAWIVPCLCFTYQGKHRYEQHCRERWVAVQGLEESQAREREQSSLAKGMQIVTEILCDCVVKIGSDMRIVGVNEKQSFHLGSELEGSFFVDIVSSIDRDRFQECLAQASSSCAPQSLPVTLTLPGGPRKAQLLVVESGSAHARWIVGVQLDESTGVPPAGEMKADVLSALKVVHDRGDILESEITFALTQSEGVSNEKDAKALVVNTSEVATQTTGSWKPPRPPQSQARSRHDRMRRPRQARCGDSSCSSGGSSESTSSLAGSIPGSAGEIARKVDFDDFDETSLVSSFGHLIG